MENEDGEVTCVGESEFHHRRRNVGIRRRIRESQRIWQSVKVSAYRVKEPEDLVSIERYLGSGAIKGIGQTMASRIVKSSGRIHSVL